MSKYGTGHHPIRSSLPGLAHILLLGTLLSVSACGIDAGYSSPRNGFTTSSAKERSLGVIHFRYGEDQEAYNVAVTKVHGGYAMTAPLYSEDVMQVNFSASHDSDSGNFLGLRSRWDF